MDPATVNPAVPDHEAVVCALGTMTEAKADRTRCQRGVRVCSSGTRNLIPAMTKHALRRIVVESSARVAESLRTGKFGAGSIIRLLLRDVMEDKHRQEASVRESGLDWTIIRPVQLSDGARSGHIQYAELLACGLLSRISRGAVATFMLDAIIDTKTLKRPITVRG